jgi:hypothetical protein
VFPPALQLLPFLTFSFKHGRLMHCKTRGLVSIPKGPPYNHTSFPSI